MDSETILKLTPADIAAMTDEELENLDHTICNLMHFNLREFNAGQIVLFDQIKDQCRLIKDIRKIEKAAKTLPRLHKQAAETVFTNPERLAGLDDLCKKYDLHVSDGGGWCCQVYKGVTFEVEANDTFGLAGYTLAQYRPAFVQELEAINAAYEQSLQESSNAK